jgi:hypothetical protein
MGKEIVSNRISLKDFKGIASIGIGGTGDNTAKEARDSLRIIGRADHNTMNGVAGLDEYGMLKDEQIPEDLFSSGHALNGPKQIVVGSTTNVYRVTYWSDFRDIQVTIDNNDVSIYLDGNGQVVIDAPSTPGIMMLTITGSYNDEIYCNKSFPIDVVANTDHVNTPSIVSPVSGAANLGPDITFIGSSFGVSGGSDTHEGTDWQLATDAGFTSIVASVTNSASDKTNWTVTELPPATQYYVRTRYKGTGTGYSNWSAVSSFTTKSSYLPTAEEAILLASDKAASDWFGCSIAMNTDGSRVAIGSMNADAVAGSNSNTGKAYIFVRSGNTWSQEAIILPNTPQTNAAFGRSVSISGQGDRIVIGANSGTSGNVVQTGLAYVFKRTGSTWTQEAILIASDAAVSDHFGLPVAMSSNGDRIAIGASAADYSGALDAGKVYIFTRSGTAWVQEAILTASDFVADAELGIVLTINANCDKVVIGTYPGSTSTPVKVYTFSRSGSVWTQVSVNQIPYTLTISSSTLNMSRDGNRLVAGNYGPFVNIGGAAIVYKWVTNTWTQETILNIPTGASGDSFGYSVSISDDGSKIAIGAIGEDPSGISSAGRVYIFTRSGTSWSQAKAFAASDMNMDDGIGGSISISGDGTRMATGAFYADPSGLYSAGKAYIFA